MLAWVVQWEYPYDRETNITLWASERLALENAASEIENKIKDRAPADQDAIDDLEKIVDTLQARQWRQAIDLWNDWENNFNEDYQEYYSVFSLDIHDPNNELSSSTPTIQGNTSYKATTPGAVCRGQCKCYSPDAYADRPDGTYVCRQCKIFQGIFGS